MHLTHIISVDMPPDPHGVPSQRHIIRMADGRWFTGDTYGPRPDAYTLSQMIDHLPDEWEPIHPDYIQSLILAARYTPTHP